jgi:ferritin-like metal-binding protein YciE
MADMKSLRDLFVENLRRAYDTEKRLVKALPKVRDAATSSDLKHAVQTHYDETELHVDRLEQVFGWLDEKPKTESCDAIKGILDDGDHAIGLDAEHPDVKDAALVAAAQEAEHFEIALYGTLRTWALELGRNDAVQVLELTLEEEKNADSILTAIATTLNSRAAHAH